MSLVHGTMHDFLIRSRVEKFNEILTMDDPVDYNKACSLCSVSFVFSCEVCQHLK